MLHYIAAADSSASDSQDEERTLVPTTAEEEMVYFSIKIAFFPGEGERPQKDEINAMLCETNKFFQEALINATNDDDLQSFATNIDWLYDTENDLPFVLYFTSDTHYGNETPVPAKTVYEVILNEADAKLLVTDFIWQSEPYPDNVFYNTQDIMLDGSYSGAKSGRSIVPGQMEKAMCPT